MSRRLAVAIVVLVALCPSHGGANPMPDPGWREMRELVVPICRGEGDSSAVRFSELVAERGLAPLTDDDMLLVRTYFDRFESALVDAQRATKAQQLWPDVHREFRTHATYKARREMSAALRPWLSADTLDVTLSDRITAAEYLSDYADLGALPLIASFADSLSELSAGAPSDSLSEAIWYLKQAARRMHDPDAGVVLRRERNGDLTLLRDVDDIRRVTCSDSGELSQEDAAVVLLSLQGGRVGRPGSIRGKSMRIKFDDGVVAVVGEGDGEFLHHYSDNHRMSGGPIGLESERLRALFWRLRTFGEVGIAKTPN